MAIADIIPPHEFPALREAVLGYSGPAREMRQGDAITRRMAVDAAMFDAIPALRELLDRADIKALFHYVASYRITPLHYIQTIVSKVGGNEPDPQETLHADSFHSSLKAWLFFNPVNANEGPFTYVPGSHRLTPERLAWERARSLADPRVVDRLSARGSPRIAESQLESLRLPSSRGWPFLPTRWWWPIPWASTVAAPRGGRVSGWNCGPMPDAIPTSPGLAAIRAACPELPSGGWA